MKQTAIGFRADGFPELFRIRSDNGILFLGAESAREFEFVELDEPPPLAPPELESPLEIDSLDLPQDLVLPDPAS